MPERRVAVRPYALLAASGLALAAAQMAVAQAIPECLYAVTAQGNRLYRVGIGPEGSELVGDIGPIWATSAPSPPTPG